MKQLMDDKATAPQVEFLDHPAICFQKNKNGNNISQDWCHASFFERHVVNHVDLVDPSLDILASWLAMSAIKSTSPWRHTVAAKRQCAWGPLGNTLGAQQQCSPWGT